MIWSSDAAPRQTNLTQDSAPGWLPTVGQIAAVRTTANDYFSAKDEGRSADAYRVLAEPNQHDQPFLKFAEAGLKFNQRAGTVRERRIVKVTWTKDPAQVLLPGVYVALDDVARFTNIDRFCGFLILYQPPSGGAFQVMREESNVLDNATALAIEQQHSRAGLDQAWAQLSSHCAK